MAKKSSIEKNNRRIRRVKQYAKRWDRLREIAHDKSAPPEERFEAQLKMAELPRNTNPTLRQTHLKAEKGRLYPVRAGHSAA